MNHEDVRQAQLISDYVLALLPPAAQNEVEAHLATCAECRAAVVAERALGAEVRQAVAAATRPEAGRLRQLMPDPPRRRAWWPLLNQGAWRPATALALLLVLFWGVLQGDIYSERAGGSDVFSSPPATILAATATTTPTATQARAPQPESAEGQKPPPATLLTAPPPAGTPLVALPARDAGR